MVPKISPWKRNRHKQPSAHAACGTVAVLPCSALVSSWAKAFLERLVCHPRPFGLAQTAFLEDQAPKTRPAFVLIPGMRFTHTHSGFFGFRLTKVTTAPNPTPELGGGGGITSRCSVCVYPSIRGPTSFLSFSSFFLFFLLIKWKHPYEKQLFLLKFLPECCLPSISQSTFAPSFKSCHRHLVMRQEIHPPSSSPPLAHHLLAHTDILSSLLR